MLSLLSAQRARRSERENYLQIRMINHVDGRGSLWGARLSAQALTRSKQCNAKIAHIGDSD
jgi:hypothetical protein